MTKQKYAWPLHVALALMLFAAPEAFARTCKVTIESNDQMQFDKEEIRIAGDCTRVELNLKHVGAMPAQAMGHNWALTRTADVQPVAVAGASAGIANSYLPAGDARVLAYTRVIGGGESDTITFSTAQLKKGEDYTFFCSFPGHWAIMRGKFVFG